MNQIIWFCVGLATGFVVALLHVHFSMKSVDKMLKGVRRDMMIPNDQ